jgi:hypothetical protein
MKQRILQKVLILAHHHKFEDQDLDQMRQFSANNKTLEY